MIEMIGTFETIIAAFGGGVAVFALYLYSRVPNGIVEDEEGSQFKANTKEGGYTLVRESLRAKQRKDDEARAQQDKILAELAASKAANIEQPASS